VTGRDDVEGEVLERQGRLQRAADRAADALTARDLRQQLVARACAAGATPLPLKPIAQELEQRLALVSEAVAFVAMARAAGVVPVVADGTVAHLLRVRTLFFQLLHDAARLDARASEQHYVGAEFRAVEDSARKYAQAIRCATAAGATIELASDSAGVVRERPAGEAARFGDVTHSWLQLRQRCAGRMPSRLDVRDAQIAAKQTGEGVSR